jgi:hypothetical protein
MEKYFLCCASTVSKYRIHECMNSFVEVTGHNLESAGFEVL